MPLQHFLLTDLFLNRQHQDLVIKGSIVTLPADEKRSGKVARRMATGQRAFTGKGSQIIQPAPEGTFAGQGSQATISYRPCTRHVPQLSVLSDSVVFIAFYEPG